MQAMGSRHYPAVSLDQTALLKAEAAFKRWCDGVPATNSPMTKFEWLKIMWPTHRL